MQAIFQSCHVWQRNGVGLGLDSQQLQSGNLDALYRLHYSRAVSTDCGACLAADLAVTSYLWWRQVQVDELYFMDECKRHDAASFCQIWPAWHFSAVVYVYLSPIELAHHSAGL